MPLTVRKFNAQVKDPDSGQMIPAGLLSSDSLQAIEAAESAAITEIQQKGAQTRESIPDDYTELSESVDELKESLIEYNAYNLLADFATYISATHNGVTYTWNENHTRCTVRGQANSSVSRTNLYADVENVPAILQKGKTYRVLFDSTDPNIKLEFVTYTNGASSGGVSTMLTKSGELEIPENCTGFVARIRVPNGKTADGYIENIRIFDAYTNKELAGIIEELTESINNGYMPFEHSIVQDEYVDTDGSFQAYSGWSRSDYIAIPDGQDVIYYTATRSSEYNAYYDANHNFISSFGMYVHAEYNGIRVPQNAKYFAYSNKTSDIAGTQVATHMGFLNDVFTFNSILHLKLLDSNADLFTLGTGSYYTADPTNMVNCPTPYGFRLNIFVRNSENTFFAVLYDGAGNLYTNRRTSTGAWGSWKKYITVDSLGTLENCTRVLDGTDLFTLPAGDYYSSASNLVNCPTNSSFRLSIIERTTPKTKIAILLTSGGELYTCGKLSNKWLSWNKFATEQPVIPEYYNDYLTDRVADINSLQDSISEKCDSFIFLTDYHILRNTQHSPALIKWIIEHTGIRKLCFCGDAYQTNIDSKATAEKYITEVYSLFNSLTDCFYPVIGNHEWNHYQSSATENITETYDISLSGVYNYCLARCLPHTKEMSIEGNYYIDNERAKIRYFFLQYDGEARPTPETIQWLGDQLENVPSGYYVMVIAHYANMDSHTAPDISTYSGRSTYFNQMVTDILQAYNTKQTYSINVSYTANGVTKTYNSSFDFTSADGNNVICVLAGHWHEDDAKQKTSNNILQVLTTGDLYKTGSGSIITYEEDGETLERTPGTTREQAFDVINIDLTARKIYFTRIGAGSDREFGF